MSQRPTTNQPAAAASSKVIAPILRKAFLYLSGSPRLGRAVTDSRLAWRAARRFVAGQTVEQAIAVVRELNGQGLTASLDHLGENVNRLEDAQTTTDAYLLAIEQIRASGARSGVSLKLTALGMDLGPDVAEQQLRRILTAAAAASPVPFVRIDMEGSAYTEATLSLFYRVRADFARVGVVVQAYLYRTAGDVERLVAEGSGPRLCKGAYLEDPAVAWPRKEDVDASYLRLAGRLLDRESLDRGVYPALATHDPAIIEAVKQMAAARGIGRDRFEFQMLHGIRRDLQLALAQDGYRVRVYVPYGRQWYPYFMRRLAERPENLAFILRSILREGRGA